MGVIRYASPRSQPLPPAPFEQSVTDSCTWSTGQRLDRRPILTSTDGHL